MATDKEPPQQPLDRPQGSLRTFHIVFVAISVLLAAIVAMWSIREYRTAGGWGNLVTAVLSLGIAVILVIYGRWFYVKLKQRGIY